MGITIHYGTEFRGTENQLLEKLEEIADFARVIGFAKVVPRYFVSYATDFNTPDGNTPMVTNPETGKEEIDGSYRWAKIQAEPRVSFGFFSYDDTSAQRKKKQKEHDTLQANMHKYNGYVLSLWIGEGSEPTNLCFIRKGKGKVWKGSSFTKTQYAKEFVKAHVAVCTLLKAAEKMGLVNEVSDEGDYYDNEDITVLADNGESNLKMIAAMTGALQDKFGTEVIGGAGLTAEEKLKDFEL